VPRLAARHEVLAVVRSPGQIVAGGPTRVVVMDLTEALEPTGLPPRIDVIIHLAQANVRFPEGAGELFAVSANATQQLLDYGRRAGARRVILGSSGDVYGRRLGSCQESDPVAPASFYAVTKRTAEMLVESYAAYLKPCNLRLFQPYGRGQSDRLIPRLADRIRQQKPIYLNRGDRPRTTPIYIDDVTCAVERAMDSAYAGTVNVAGDTVVSMRELAEAIGRVIERRPVFEERDEESGDLAGDNGLMKRVFGEWPMVGLTDGLSRALRPKEDTRCRVHV
jgi:nucleoside-diphosphate-sugar epimerase